MAKLMIQDNQIKMDEVLDTITGAFKTITHPHHEIHGGSHYFVQSYADIPGVDDVLDFSWQMPNTTKWSHWTWSIFTEKAITWLVYENAVVGTAALANTITPLNSNRNSTNTSGTTMKYEIQADLAAANADMVVTGATLLASGKLGDNRTGGFDSREHEIIMKQNTLYCLRALASAAGYINFDMDWYEHTNRS